MAERVKWWKAFLPKKRTGSSREQASTYTYGADFDPFAQSDKPKDSKTTTEPSPPQQESTNGSYLLSNETYDDSHLESLFNEQTCRRNMKVSRSGRFKEKRKVRSSLPVEDKGTENMVPGTQDFR